MEAEIQGNYKVTLNETLKTLEKLNQLAFGPNQMGYCIQIEDDGICCLKGVKTGSRSNMSSVYTSIEALTADMAREINRLERMKRK